MRNSRPLFACNPSAPPPATIDVQGLADAEAVNPFRLPRNHSGSRCGGLAPAREALFIGRFRVSRSLELALADHGVAWIGCPSWRSGTRPAPGGGSPSREDDTARPQA